MIVPNQSATGPSFGQDAAEAAWRGFARPCPVHDRSNPDQDGGEKCRAPVGPFSLVVRFTPARSRSGTSQSEKTDQAATVATSLRPHADEHFGGQ
jgi:hypothetical protein